MNEIPNQLSAEEILKDIYGRRKQLKKTTKVEILDLEELKEYQRRKRTEYESVLKVKRLDIGQWMRYAQFEIDQHDVRRARSVFERALQINTSYVPLWIRYIDSEVKSKNINHARNLLDRATTLLPRVEKLWFKYVMIEESLGNVSLVRALFIKWCSMEPSNNAWDAFINFEIRHKQFEIVREIYSRYVMVHPEVNVWMKWVDFETKHGDVQTIRQVYSLGLDTISSFEATSEDDVVTLISHFAHWEASQQELERSGALYRVAAQKWPQSSKLEDSRVQFEKMFGNGSDVENSIIIKRKRKYEQHLTESSRDYDTWWLYLDLIEDNFPLEIIPAFEKSVDNNEPLNAVKDIQWRRYIFLWIRYVTYLEVHNDDIDGTRKVYRRLINDVIPHKKFTFSKLWLMYSNFELRQGNLDAARKILGTSLGMCPKIKTYKKYIELEISLKEFDRVRKLYERYLNFFPGSAQNWISYADLEENLGDEERARGIYEIALSHEVGLAQNSKFQLLQRYISFEVEAGEYNRARSLYERLLKLSDYSPKIWINWGIFESSVPSQSQLNKYEESRVAGEDLSQSSDGEEEQEFEIDDENRSNTRKVFENALTYFKSVDDKESRITILKAYENYEAVHGTPETQEKIARRLPKVVKKKRAENNIEKEYIDYIFPEDSATSGEPNLKILALAKKWNKDRMNAGS